MYEAAEAVTIAAGHVPRTYIFDRAVLFTGTDETAVLPAGLAAVGTVAGVVEAAAVQEGAVSQNTRVLSGIAPSTNAEIAVSIPAVFLPIIQVRLSLANVVYFRHFLSIVRL